MQYIAKLVPLVYSRFCLNKNKQYSPVFFIDPLTKGIGWFYLFSLQHYFTVIEYKYWVAFWTQDLAFVIDSIHNFNGQTFKPRTKKLEVLRFSCSWFFSLVFKNDVVQLSSAVTSSLYFSSFQLSVKQLGLELATVIQDLVHK